MENQMENQTPAVVPQPQPQVQQVQLPSLYYVKCPHCGGTEFRILGKKGAMGKSLAIGAAFGAIGMLVANSVEETRYEFEPTNYKCKGCGKKFESMPLVAQPEEILPQPALVAFKRKGAFYGWAVTQFIWLNGVKISGIANGKVVEFPVFTRFNTLFVTDQMGVAFKGSLQFEAQPGQRVEVNFKAPKFR